MTSRSATLTPPAPPSPDRRADRRLHKRGQKKVSPWFPGRTPPVFPGWYDVLVEDQRSRLYWGGGEWLMKAGPVGCPFDGALARRRFFWRGIDRSYYEIGTSGTPVRRVTARRP